MVARERWVELRDYPGYSASSYGNIRNDRRYHVLTPVVLPDRRPFVKMTVGGIQISRNISKLVCDTFVIPERPDWTTPIHFDGNLHNCHVENLDWRPRWFALKHTEQFHKDLPEFQDPVREVRTGSIFDTPWDPVFRFGLLYMDLLLSILNKTYVFPTMQTFEWA